MNRTTQSLAVLGLSWLVSVAPGGNCQAQGEEQASTWWVAAAKKDLARRLGAAEREIELVGKAESLNWPDASLGCPEPGQMYAQILTPGLKFTLKARGKWYEYHTGNDVLRLCEGD